MYYARTEYSSICKYAYRHSVVVGKLVKQQRGDEAGGVNERVSGHPRVCARRVSLSEGGRRYCYIRQPEMASWNLAQLAEALVRARLLSGKQAEEAGGGRSHVHAYTRAIHSRLEAAQLR